MMWLRRFWGEERRDLWRKEVLVIWGRGGRAPRFEVGGGVGRGWEGISTGSSSQKLSRKSRRWSVSADEKRSSIGEREREDRGTGEVDSRDYVNRRRVVTGERRVCPPFHPSVRKMSGLPADEVVQDGQGTLETQQLQQLGQGHEVVVGAVEGPRKGEYEGC